VAQLADAIRQFMDDPVRRAAMGTQGEKKVYQRYTWDHVYSRLVGTYQHLAQLPGGIKTS